MSNCSRAPAESLELLMDTTVMLQMARLEHLLEGCQDLRERLLGLMTPRALALLACVSSSLRSSVAALPEASWQARVHLARSAAASLCLH